MLNFIVTILLLFNVNLSSELETKVSEVNDIKTEELQKEQKINETKALEEYKKYINDNDIYNIGLNELNNRIDNLKLKVYINTIDFLSIIVYSLVVISIINILLLLIKNRTY